jgi:hypothetical protein
MPADVITVRQLQFKVYNSRFQEKCLFPNERRIVRFLLSHAPDSQKPASFFGGPLAVMSLDTMVDNPGIHSLVRLEGRQRGTWAKEEVREKK